MRGFLFLLLILSLVIPASFALLGWLIAEREQTQELLSQASLALDAKNGELAILSQQAANLQKERDMYRNQLEGLQNDLSKATGVIHDLEQQIMSLRSENQMIVEALELKSKELEEMHTLIAASTTSTADSEVLILEQPIQRNGDHAPSGTQPGVLTNVKSRIQGPPDVQILSIGGIGLGLFTLFSVLISNRKTSVVKRSEKKRLPPKSSQRVVLQAQPLRNRSGYRTQFHDDQPG